MKKYIYSLVPIMFLTFLSGLNLIGMTQNGYASDDLEQLFPELDDDYWDSSAAFDFTDNRALSQETQMQDDEPELEADDRKEEINHNLRICPYCSKSFNRPSNFTVHIKTHIDVKPYQCLHEGCGKCFLLMRDLNIHKKTHMVIRFICPYEHCYFPCVSQASRKVHIKTHERKTLFSCPFSECNKEYTLNSNLMRHIEKCHG